MVLVTFLCCICAVVGFILGRATADDGHDDDDITEIFK